AVAGYGATVLEYLLGAEGGWAWVITPAGRIDAVRLTLTREHLATMVAALPAALRGPDGGRAVLAELSEALIGPLPPGLLPPPGAPLAVVPHGDLFGVPFAALRDGMDGRYLHERYALVMLPSIGTIPAAGLVGTPPARPDHLLAVANPAFESLPSRADPSRADPSRADPSLADPSLADPSLADPGRADPSPAGPAGLAALPEVEAALPAFARLLAPGATRRFTGEQATLARLAEVRPGELVLLATHGIADIRDPANCFLALAAMPGHDGRARIHEIAALPLDSPLVALLACWTAAGRITGDGVLGLSRAFLLAGANSVLASLWTVGEETGTQVVYRMLAGWLRTGHSRAEALRCAQAELARQYPDRPLLWAALQLTGAWS
ncbi:CHAT domain-containing protein, partial [Frankia sp. AiPs1]|uniref:CHAT domain-containing protein n=1 Tax=Frankia sp. AiPs1 TaxID=573493 RepID=UPI002042DB71